MNLKCLKIATQIALIVNSLFMTHNCGIMNNYLYTLIVRHILLLKANWEVQMQNKSVCFLVKFIPWNWVYSVGWTPCPPLGSQNTCCFQTWISSSLAFGIISLTFPYFHNVFILFSLLGLSTTRALYAFVITFLTFLYFPNFSLLSLFFLKFPELSSINTLSESLAYCTAHFLHISRSAHFACIGITFLSFE